MGLRHIRFSVVPPRSKRIHFVNSTDVSTLLKRLPEELWKRLRAVHFNDQGRGARVLGYTNRGRHDIALCALPRRVSLGGCCRRFPASPAEFGATWGAKWPALAVRRFMLYDVFLHELGHLQEFDVSRPSRRLRYYDEKLAQEFANSWRERLWSIEFDHPDPVHNRPHPSEFEPPNLVRSSLQFVRSSPKTTDGMIIVISDRAKFTLGDGSVRTIGRGTCLKVKETDGVWHAVTYGGAFGRVRHNDVIPFDAGIAFFTEAIQRDPRREDYVARARIWSKQGEYARSIQDLDQAVRLWPNDWFGYASRAIEFQYLGELDAAIADIGEVIRLSLIHDSHPMCISSNYHDRGLVWFDKGEYAKAIADFSEAIRIDEGSAVAYSSRGDAWKARQHYNRAIADYDEAIRLNPDWAGNYVERAISWTAIGEYDNAVADYNKAIELEPENALTFDARAWFRATCPSDKYRDGKNAIADATKALELWSGLSVNTLAAAYAEAGAFDIAVKWQEQAFDDAADGDKAAFLARLELYRLRQPYRDEPKR